MEGSYVCSERKGQEVALKTARRWKQSTRNLAIDPQPSLFFPAAVCPSNPDVRRDLQGQIRSPAFQGMPDSSCSWVILAGPEDIVSIK